MGNGAVNCPAAAKDIANRTLVDKAGRTTLLAPFMSLLIGILTFVLIIVSLFLIFVVLMQRAKSDGGVGAAMGGGVAESTFGAETGNVLSKSTINAAIAFFVISFALYLANIYQSKHHETADSKLPTIIVPAATAKPATAPITPPPGEKPKP